MVPVGDLSILVRGRRIEVRREVVLVATGSWDGCSIGDRVGTLAPTGVPSDEEALWTEIASEIAKDEETALVQAASSTYDAEGVDLSLIDWMLTMTPTDRLRTLERHAAGLAPFVPDDRDD
jgi:hypothetical protein